MDVVRGYWLLAEKGEKGGVYNQGSQRANSVLSYILLGLEKANYTIERIETQNGDKEVVNPTEKDDTKMFGIKFEKTAVDKIILNNELEYTLADKGLNIYTDKGKVLVEFDQKRFRPAEVPILMSDTRKIQKIGFKIEHKLKDIIGAQLNYFIDRNNRV